MSRKFLTPLLLVILAGCICPLRAMAADWDPVTDAEKTMKSNPLDPGAGAVVLFNHGKMDVFERTAGNWATRRQIYVRIKIFNDAGRDAGNVSIESFKDVRLSKVEGRTILSSGEIVPLDSSKVFHGKEYEEGKKFAILKTSFTFPSVEPGAIIEYQVEENEDWLFPNPWTFDTRGYGTLDASLEVTIGPRLDMDQYPLDTTANKISVTQSSTVKGSRFVFSVKNLRPIQSEPFSLPFRDLAAMVLFTPVRLGFSGEVFPLITKWDDVGTEITREFNNMQKTSKLTREKAKELTDKISDPRQKAEAIYKYLQQSITSSDLAGVGFGRAADEIISSKRGDPDEINAIMVMMLKEAKVDADMVLVATKNWQTLVRNFPNFNQFSRMITRINFKDGPVFADPADPGAAFGDLPWFDRGVMGLAVKGTKVQEAQIPAGAPEDNLSTMKATVQVRKDWTAEGDVEVNVKGSEAIELRDDVIDLAPDKTEKMLTDFFGYGHSDAEVSQITHPDFRDSSQPLLLKAHIKEIVTNDAGPGGLLLNPWMGDQYERPLFKAVVRHSAVRFNNPERTVSTSTWQIAPEIKIEQLPKDVNVENDLGGFSHSCVQNTNTVTCTRTYYLKKMMLQTNVEYLNAKKFFDDIAKNDQEVIVLRGQ